MAKIRAKTTFMKSLYAEFKDDLVKNWAYQRGLYREMYPNVFFDDVEAEWLYLLTRHLQPSVCVEVGSGVGWTTSWILRALRDNGNGLLFSYDVTDASTKKIPVGLRDRWRFHHGDVAEAMDAMPKKIDFLLIDSSHDSPFVDWFIPDMCERVTGYGFIHDIYMLPTPAQGEYIAAEKWLDEKGISPFSPSKVFPKSFDAIQKVREQKDLVHSCDVNPSLVFKA